jgi:hypothetical protein
MSSSFALGLGPVPFMLTADLVPYYVRASWPFFLNKLTNNEGRNPGYLIPFVICIVS